MIDLVKCGAATAEDLAQWRADKAQKTRTDKEEELRRARLYYERLKQQFEPNG